MSLSFFVPGKPAPQGSKRYLGVKGGKGITVESSKAVAPWRADVRAGAEKAMASGQTGFVAGEAVIVRLMFVMPRPASTPKRRTPAAVKRPDLDKLSRACLDALTSAGAFHDDSQVVDLSASKRIAELDEVSGCVIVVEPGAAA